MNIGTTLGKDASGKWQSVSTPEQSIAEQKEAIKKMVNEGCEFASLALFTNRGIKKYRCKKPASKSKAKKAKD